MSHQPTHNLPHAPPGRTVRLNLGADEVELKLDCRHYRGDRPCAKGCQGRCQHHEPMGHRILLIKLGALGDVIRTEALLPGIRRAYFPSQVTWVSKPSGCRMLANNPLIDRLYEFNCETLTQLKCEHFDLILSLDKEPGPAAWAMTLDAPDKRGVGLSRFGTVYPLNAAAQYYFSLGLSDELKFRHNQSSYQRLIYEAVGLPYSGERYTLYPDRCNLDYARGVFERAGLTPAEEVIGLNTGAGSVFANKTWPPDKFVDLALRLGARGDCRVVLLGGPDEESKNKWISRQVGTAAIDLGCRHGELDFAALVRRCTVVLTGDTTALHVAVALRVPVIALFGPTCPQEIDLYGRGLKLISRIECAPCYRRTCDYVPNCMDLIGVEQAEEALARYLGRGPTRTPEPTCRDDSVPIPLHAPTGERVN